MNSLKTILRVAGIGLLLVFVVLVANQTWQLYNLIARWNPTAAWAALLTMLLLYAVFLALPVYAFLRYRKQLPLPDPNDRAGIEEYRKQMLERFRENKRLQSELPEWNAIVDADEQWITAVDTLNERANAVIRKEATSVFLTTAVSQNGSLDALFMLGSVTRLVWRLIHLYETRPAWGRVANLYTNVLGTVILARTIEDMDLIESQLEPLIASLVGGSVFNLIPGAATVTNLVVSSLTEGAFNAMLTLRVGAIARSYLSADARPDRGVMRRSASLEAAGQLGGILKENAIAVAKAFGRAAKKAGKATFGL